MTEGIVSNENRKIGNLSYIQTSSSVNPGCSGGPLFNRKGNLAGLIVLKARLEGAGFAVPAPEIRKFLEMAKKAAENKGGKQ